MSHRPRFLPQHHDPFTTHDFSLCTMACGAMALDYHTEGAIRLTGGQLVAKANLTEGNIANGTNLDEVAKAWKKISEERHDKSIALQVRKNKDWSDVTDALANGRAVILQGNYNVLDDKFTCQPGTLPGDGGHALLLLPERDGDRIFVGDPLCPVGSDFKPIPEAELRKFAEKFRSPGKVLHANTKKFPVGAAALPRGLDPRFDSPVAICDVAPTTLFADAIGKTALKQNFTFSPVGLYTRPVKGTARAFAAIRVDMAGPGVEDFRVCWVADSAISNVRLPPTP